LAAKATKNAKSEPLNGKTSKSPKPASSMEELLAVSGHNPKGLLRGGKIEGIVVEVAPRALVLDVGAKAEGLVRDVEFEVAKTYIRTLKPGDKIQATVVVPEGEGGYVLLSLRETAENFIWDWLVEKQKSGEEVEARVESATRGGLSVNVGGVLGFVPTSHLGSGVLDNPSASTGKNILVKVIEADRAKSRLMVSEKAVSEKEFLHQQSQVLAKIRSGEKFVGRVTKVINFGIFVEITKDETPVEGLVHVSEISWQKTGNPAEVFSEGDEVEVIVIGMEGGKLALSIKRLQENPWEAAIGKYEKDQQVAGRVTKTGDFGAFIELEPGVEGLVHSSKMGEQTLTEGQEINVFIEDIDQKSKKLSLGLVLKAVPVGYR